MDNKNSNGKWIAVVILALVVVLGIVLILPKNVPSKYKNLEVFAQCLTDKGTKMYGAYWCSHCKAQKEKFGDSFKKIKYIECTENPKECEAAGITSYPTWIFSTGEKLSGETPLELLAEKSACVLESK
jgi:hypothetical protein